MNKLVGRLPLLLLFVIAFFAQGLAPAFAAWTAPVELIAAEGPLSTFDPLGVSMSTSSLAVQGDGVAHLVYVEKTGKVYSLIHQTNRTGSWQKETITSSTMKLGSPAAVVYKRRLYIVWTRGANRNSEIMSATGADGAWSTSRLTANSAPDVSPAIAVHAGKIYIAWLKATRAYPDGSVDAGAIYVKSNSSGRWRTEKIGGEEYISVGEPMIKVDGAGAAHVVYAAYTDQTGSALIIHADNAAGAWRQERLPVNAEGRGRAVSAEMPSLAVYKKAVYVAFMRTPVDMPMEGHLVLAVKKSGVWRWKTLTKPAGIGFSAEPLVTISRGRVKVAYTNMEMSASKIIGMGSTGLLKSEVRYLELVHGRPRKETIDSESVAFDSTTGTPPPFTEFAMVGFNDARGVAHAAYLRLTIDAATEKVGAQLMYSRRDPD